MFNDAPKVEHLKQEFPELYRGSKKGCVADLGETPVK